MQKSLSMQKSIKWGSNAVTVLIGLLMIITIYFFVSSRLNGGVPKVMGQESYIVLSGSMEPRIHTGSVILDQPNVDTRKLKAGDVITFRLPQNDPLAAKEGATIVTHRIANVLTQNGMPAYKTKGDANKSQDPWTISPGNVIAKYDNVTIPYLGYYFNFLKSKLGIGLLIILPGVLLIISTIVSLLREILKLQRTSKPETPAETSKA